MCVTKQPQDLFDQIKLETGFSRDQLRGRFIRKGLVKARRKFIKLALDANYTYAAIGRHLNRDHTTILYHARTIER